MAFSLEILPEESERTIQPFPRKVLVEQDVFELLDTDLMGSFSVETGYLVKAVIDFDRFIEALKLTLCHYPLVGATLHRPQPNVKTSPWYFRLEYRPITLEVHKRKGDAYLPADSVLQPEWKYSPKLDVPRVYAAEDVPLFKMRITYLVDYGWSVLAITSSHVLGDGTFMANLWKSVSEAYTTGSVSEIPLYERQTHPRSALDGWDIKATEADLPALTARGPKPVDFPVEKITFTVSDHDLALLKKGILAEDKSVTILSTQDCLTAAILVAQTRSQEDLGWFDPPVCNLLNVFNSRENPIEGPNHLLWATARWSNPYAVAQIAKAIRDSLIKIRDPTIRAPVALVHCDLYRDAADRQEGPDFTPQPGWAVLNSSIKTDFSKADFGHGPSHFITMVSKSPRYMKMFRRNPRLFPQSDGPEWKPGVEISFHLKPPQVQPFFKHFHSILNHSPVHGRTPNLPHILGAQGVNLWKLEQHASAQRLQFTVQDASAAAFSARPRTEFPDQWFTQPLDHFDKVNNKTFGQRYWVNKRHYDPDVGGPVIVLDGGETSGEDRIPFLDTGIVEILAKATGGIGIVLEHRYYGKSIAVPNLSTDNLRWLNNAQSAADSANFMANLKLEGIDRNITAPGTPWIYYGGSYAGARAAHMKILYPDLVWGAIASSAVTHATIVNWEYMEIIRQYADPKCSRHLVNAIKTIDEILSHQRLSKPLKRVFGLADLEHDEDFVSVLESPLGAWQAKCWDPAVGSTRFDEFCTALNKPPFSRSQHLSDLSFGHADRMVDVGDGLGIDFTILNYANYIKTHYVSRCPEGVSKEDCFGTFDEAPYQETGLEQTWRLWIFQVCTEWGYFMTAPPDANQPRIISKLIDLAYESKICRQAFPPGKYFTVPPLPNVTVVNELGDFDIATDRLAFIDGEVDPWKPDTPHSDYAKDREDTILQPFKIIPNGVHHYDEYGLANIADEPPEIYQIHLEMIDFVKSWLEDWDVQNAGKGVNH